MTFSRPSTSRPSTARLRTPLRLAAAGLLGLGVLGLPAVTADAHVTVRADEDTAGSFSQLTFRVPNESDTAGTVKLSVQLPQDTPFAFVSAKPVPGWTVEAEEAPLPTPIEAEGTTITKAVRTVTWTAEKGTRIEPGQYQDFSISAGPLPEASLSMPALQTYSDGKVVAWNQPTPESGEEPELPAPTVQVVAAAAEEPGSDAAAGASATPAGAAPAAAATTGADPTARWLAGAALLVGIAAGALGALGLRRPRSVSRG